MHNKQPAPYSPFAQPSKITASATHSAQPAPYSSGDHTFATGQCVVEGNLLLQPTALRQPTNGDCQTAAPPPDLCGCFDDVETCCLGWWCPSILFGSTLNRAGITQSTISGVLIYLAFKTLLFVLLWLFIVATMVLVAVKSGAPEMACLCATTNITNGTNATGTGSWGFSSDLMEQRLTVGHGGVLNAPDALPYEDPDGSSLRLLTEVLEEEPLHNETAHRSGGPLICPDGLTQLPMYCADHWSTELFVTFYMVYAVFVFALCAATGMFFGYYRRRVYAMHQRQLPICGSFWLHCFPYTHACALCQEARLARRDDVAAVSVSAVFAPKKMRVSASGNYGMLSEAV